MATAEVRMNESVEGRHEAADNLRSANPDRIPMIIISPMHSVGDHRKLLVRHRQTTGEFLRGLRRRLTPKPRGRLYLLVRGNTTFDTVAPLGHSIEQLYEDFKGDDGFLYVTLSPVKPSDTMSKKLKTD